MLKRLPILFLLIAVCVPVAAHHNPVVYDGKQTVKITGVVKSARFAFPHSRYVIEVSKDDGSTEQWLLMTEDPRDAERLGFAEALKEIKAGDTITAVGWPNKIKAREIRGHQLHLADGRVVMMRRGNYIWTVDLKRIWRLRDGQIEYPAGIESIVVSDSAIDNVLAFAKEADAPARIAYEIGQERARLIGIDRGAGAEFPGVDDLFICHARREDFRMEISIAALNDAQKSALDAQSSFIERYNDLLSRYWEYDIESC